MSKEEVLLTAYVKMAGGSGALSALLHREGPQLHSHNGQINPRAYRWRPSCWGALDQSSVGVENQLCELFRRTFGVLPAVNAGSFYPLNPQQFGYAPHWGIVVPRGQLKDYRLQIDSGGVQFFTQREFRYVTPVVYDDLADFDFSGNSGIFDRERDGVLAGYETLLKKAVPA